MNPALRGLPGARRAVLRTVTLLLMSFCRSPLASRSPRRLAGRVIHNHLIPAAARAAYRPAVVRVNGVLMDVPAPPPWGGGGEFHMQLGTYERWDLNHLLGHLHEGDTFVDVGSHIGYYALPAASRVGASGRVFALEPYGPAADRLRLHKHLNGFSCLCIVPIAASDIDGEGVMHVSSASTMWNTIEADGRAGYGEGSVPVELTRLDTLLGSFGWPAVRAMKVDAEGAEPSVLAGATGLLDRNPRLLLMVEVQGGDRTGPSMASVDFLLARGFGLYRLNWRGVPQSLSRQALAAAMARGDLFNLFATRPARVS